MFYYLHMAKPNTVGNVIAAMLSEGRSGSEIAAVTGCARSSISYHRRKAGIPVNQGVFIHDWVTIRKEYEAGALLHDLRRAHGFSSTAWYNAIRRGKITEIPGRGKEGRVAHGIATMKRYASVMTDPEKCRARRYEQMDREENLAQQMRNEGYEVFSPTVPCDRIAIKDRKVFFVEFKKKGQKLRPSQEKLRATVPEMYLIVYHD